MAVILVLVLAAIIAVVGGAAIWLHFFTAGKCGGSRPARAQASGAARKVSSVAATRARRAAPVPEVRSIEDDEGENSP
jgi:hypothetical protein